MSNRISLILLALFFVASIAHGQVVFDNDSNDGTWENAVNWSGDTLPGPLDNTQIHSGLTASLTSDQTITDFTVASDGAKGTSGTVNHSSGTLSGSGASWAKVGTDGAGNDGTYTMTGTASLTSFDVFALGIVEGTGVLNLSDSASITTGMGVALGGNATVNQTGGTFTSGAWIGISNFGGGTVNYNISSGSMISNGDILTVGEDGIGNLNVSGDAFVQANGLSMIVGRNDNSTGTLDITGSNATVEVTFLTVDNDIAVGASGTLSWTADACGVTSILSADTTEFGDNAQLSVDLTADANFGSWGDKGTLVEILLIDNANAITGTFSGLPEGADVDIGGGKMAPISYVGGADGNDVVLQVLSSTVFVPPATFTVFRGMTITADLFDFECSDDVRARFNPGFVLNSSEAPVWLIFDAVAALATDFRVESQAGTPGLSYTVEAFNWNTNSYDVIGTQSESFNADSVDTFALTSPDQIDAGGEVRSRVGWRKTGLTINFPWEVRVDQAGWVE